MQTVRLTKHGSIEKNTLWDTIVTIESSVQQLFQDFNHVYSQIIGFCTFSFSCWQNFRTFQIPFIFIKKNWKESIAFTKYTICFSKRLLRLRPWDVEISSNAFIVKGATGPIGDSRFSTTRFWQSCSQRENQGSST